MHDKRSKAHLAPGLNGKERVYRVTELSNNTRLAAIFKNCYFKPGQVGIRYLIRPYIYISARLSGGVIVKQTKVARRPRSQFLMTCATAGFHETRQTAHARLKTTAKLL